MAFFEKKFCELCNDKVNLLTRMKLSEGYLCSACSKKLSGFSSDWSQRTIADVQQHLAEREQNKIKYSQFQRSATAGPNSELVVDNTNHLFYFACGRDYREGNPEIFQFNQLVDYYISEDYDAFTKDSDGDGVPDSRDTMDNRTGEANQQAIRKVNQMNPFANPLNLPPQIQQYVRRENNAYTEDGMLKDITGLNLNFTVNHPYINSIRIDVSTSDGNLMNRYQACFQVMQLCEQIKGNPMMGGVGMGQMGYAQPGMQMGMQPGMQPMGMQPGMQMGMQPGMQPMGMQPGMQPMGMQPGMQPGMQMGMQPGMQPMGMQPGMQPMGMQPGMQPMGMQPGMQGYPQAGMMGAGAMGTMGGMVVACPFCGKPTPTGSAMCPNCGSTLQ
ncbi:DUF4428 domain-containing protein [Clostridiales bacterium COT073_COT-073]|nr:DUF4428 domain-containing protein [Clostridiales bacterium COT073_COT-073]